MTALLLIRHGETAWNAEQRLQGHVDIPLNAEGKRQAAALGRVLLDKSLDAIFSSDLQRALQTAQAIAAPRGMDVTVDPGLRERCFGAFEGMRYDEIAVRYPQDYSAWRARDANARYPAGARPAETLNEFFARAVGSIDVLLRERDYRNVAIVTHGGVLDCLYRAAKRIDFSRPRDFDIFNAGINRLNWHDGILQIVQWADVAHLAPSVLDEIDR